MGRDRKNDKKKNKQSRTAAGPGGEGARKSTDAERADPFALYENSVQRPEDDVEFFDGVFRKLRGRKPLLLREDFCGTAKLSSVWCRSDRRRQAVAMDLDEPTLEWARQHNLAPHAKTLGARMQLVRRDVLTPPAKRVDLVCAMNFSFCVFKERATLRRYLASVHRTLAADGMVFLELYGGTEAVQTVKEEREFDGWTYVWQQKAYDPITCETLCHIHFEFPDGSKRKRAFTYDWRLWSVPEVRDLLLEVGFREVRVFWAQLGDDPVDEGEVETRYWNGDYEEVAGPIEQQETWLVQIAGLK